MAKKDSHKDSTTDFFLKFITRQKEEKKEAEKEEKEIFLEEGNSVQDKTVYLILKGVNMINILLDKILSSRISIKVLSFVMTIFLVFVINGGSIGSVLSTPTGGEELKDVPVDIEGLDEGYVVSGVPQKVNVVLVGPSLDIISTKARHDYAVFLDLSKVSEGENTVRYQYRNFSSNLKVVFTSEEITITVSKAVTAKQPIEAKFINQEALGKSQSISIRDWEHREVEFSGSQEAIGKVHVVNAEIDLRKIDLDKTNFTYKANIVAYDRSGKKVDVKFTVDTVQVGGVINSYSKEVNVVPKIVGNPVEGSAIAKIVMPEDKITIYGEEDTLKGINEVKVVINVEGLAETREEKNVVIEEIEGIDRMSAYEIKTVEIVVEKEITKEITEIPIIIKNNDQNAFKVKFGDGQDKATIRVTGAQSLIEKLGITDCQVTIDVGNLQEGPHELEINARVTNSLVKYELISNKRLIITLER